MRSNKKKALISVVLPVYNVENYILKSINSILDKIEGEDLIFHLILFFMVVFLWLPIYIMPFGGNKNE